MYPVFTANGERQLAPPLASASAEGTYPDDPAVLAASRQVLAPNLRRYQLGDEDVRRDRDPQSARYELSIPGNISI